MTERWQYLTPRLKLARIIEIAFHDAFLFLYATLLLYFVGGFSLRGTIAAIVLLWLVWSWHRQSLDLFRATHESTASPYEVNIQPNLPKMLRDLGLVSAE